MRLPSGWTKVKWQKFESGFRKELFVELQPKVEKAVQNAFIATQESFIREIPAHEAPMLPFITGNLHDSIVSVVSSHGHVVKASYTPSVATTTSSSTGKKVFKATSGMGRKRIIGSLAAFNAVKNAQGKYPGKIAMTLFVAVPYSLRPNEKGPHMGYLDNLRALYAFALESEFRRGIARAIIEMKGSLNNYVQLAYDEDDMRIAKTVRQPGKRGRKKGSKNSTMGSAAPGLSLKITR